MHISGPDVEDAPEPFAEVWDATRPAPRRPVPLAVSRGDVPRGPDGLMVHAICGTCPGGSRRGCCQHKPQNFTIVAGPTPPATIPACGNETRPRRWRAAAQRGLEAALRALAGIRFRSPLYCPHKETTS